MPPLEQSDATVLQGRRWVRRTDLARLFPAVFGEKVWKPLKIGIDQDLLSALGQDVHVNSVRRCLRIHTHRPEYLRALAAGGLRFCLDGTPSGEVSTRDQEFATKALETLQQQGQEIRERMNFLRAFEASGLSEQAYAIRECIAIEKVRSDIDRALKERRARRERHMAIARKFEHSGLSTVEYAAKVGVSLEKLEWTLAQVASRSPTDYPGPPAPTGEDS